MRQVPTIVDRMQLRVHSGDLGGRRRSRAALPYACRLASDERIGGRRAVGAWFRTCLVLALLAVILPVCAENIDPQWQEPSALARLVFTRPHQENFCLLSGPAKPGDTDVTGVKAWSGSSECPVRQVWADATNAYFLVDCRGVPEQQVVALYLLTNAVPAEPDANFSDPLPVRFYAQRTAGQDLPVTWDQLQILDTRVDRDPFYQALADFDVVDGTPTGWYRGDWQRKNHLFQLSSWVLVPVAGRYVFGLKTEQPVWLTVDGKLVLEQHGSRHAAWNTARPREIAPGLHHVVACGVVSRQELRMAAGWTQEGRTNSSDAVAITGGELVRARFERSDRRLHAFAVATVAQPYRFEGISNVFAQVRLESGSVSWDGSPLVCSWRLDGRELGSGHVCKTVLCTAPGTRDIGLTVADNHGHTSQDTVPVVLDGPPRNQYCVSGRLVGVPTIGYGEDPVRPEIHVRATSPDGIDFTVEATLARAGGSVTMVTGLVDIVRSWGRLVLPAGTADAFDRIDWRVLHGGVVLDCGALVFDHESFRNLPDALDGDMLCARTNALMLVARQASVGEPALFAGVRPGQRLLLLDGFLSPDGGGDTNLAAQLDRALAGARAGLPTGDSASVNGGASSASPSSYRHLNLRAMETSNSADGVARLLPLVQAGSLLPADVVVLAPSFDALGQGETLAQFERRLAALTGLLSGPGHATVVLVTPPPFAILPGCEGLAAVGVRPPEARQLSELVCRVADAHGLPVADLYTSFMTAGDCASLTRGGTLTAAGMEQAVEVLRRVLLKGY